MKNEQLKRLIKEEIKKILKENPEELSTSKLSTNTGQEKISGGDFNTEIIQFLRDIKMDKGGIAGPELKNLLDLFKKIVQKAREGNLNQPIEDRIIKALMLKIQPEPGA